MTETDFPSTVAYVHPSGVSLGPAVEQLRMLQGQALKEGRRDDAADYDRMVRQLLSRMRTRRREPPMWKKIAFSVFLSAVIVLSIHYLL